MAVRGGQAGDDSLDPALVRLAVIVLTGAITSLLDTAVVASHSRRSPGTCTPPWPMSSGSAPATCWHCPW